MCEVSGVFRQHEQTSRQRVPHVLVPRYVGEHAVLNDLGREGAKGRRVLNVRAKRKSVFHLHCAAAVVLIHSEPAPRSFFFLLLSLQSRWMRGVLQLNVKSTATRDLTHLCLHIPAVIRNDRVDVLSISGQQEVSTQQRRWRRLWGPAPRWPRADCTAVSPMGRGSPTARCMYISSLSPTSRTSPLLSGE